MSWKTARYPQTFLNQPPQVLGREDFVTWIAAARELYLTTRTSWIMSVVFFSAQFNRWLKLAKVDEGSFNLSVLLSRYCDLAG